MKWGVLVFPGSNDDDDALHALREVLDQDAVPLWHKDADLRGVEVVFVPGGFSYGDYLRCGALARFSPVMRSVRAFADAGGLVVGACNGFQILCEAGLLPGALLRNRSLTFVSEVVRIRVENSDTAFTNRCRPGEVLEIPIKHGDGCYFVGDETLAELERNRQILFRYVDAAGEATAAANPNGAVSNVAGVMNRAGNVFGMMPHPEHAAERLLGGDDGLKLFGSILASGRGSGARPRAAVPAAAARR